MFIEVTVPMIATVPLKVVVAIVSNLEAGSLWV
jgi:hypothetical protein